MIRISRIVMGAAIMQFAFIADVSFAAKDTTNILFIGNSYTYYNDIPGTIDSMAVENNHLVYIDKAVKPGYALFQHTKDSITLDKISSREWDVVIIQERGSLISNGKEKDEQDSYKYARKLDSLVKVNNKNVKVIFYSTWTPKMGNPTLSGDNFEKALLRIQDGYKTIADELGAKIAPVGKAWKLAIELNPNLDLWHQDKYHANKEGSYLASCIIYTTIFKKLKNNKYTATVDVQNAVFLQGVSKKIKY